MISWVTFIMNTVPDSGTDKGVSHARRLEKDTSTTQHHYILDTIILTRANHFILRQTRCIVEGEGKKIKISHDKGNLRDNPVASTRTDRSRAAACVKCRVIGISDIDINLLKVYRQIEWVVQIMGCSYARVILFYLVIYMFRRGNKRCKGMSVMERMRMCG